MLSLIRILPNFRGKVRVVNFILGSKIRKIIHVIIYAKYGLKFRVPNLVDNISNLLFINGIYEKILINNIVKTLPQNSVFVDVGANIGVISVFVAKRRPDVRVVAIEASNRLFNYLSENKKINDLYNLEVFNLAIHSEDNLELNFFTPEDKFGKGSFSPVFTNISEKVPTKRLDTLLNELAIKPYIIKVDVEGYEKMIFESLGAYLDSNTIPVILFEFVDWAEAATRMYSPGDAQRYLIEKDYRLSKLISNKELCLLNPLSYGSADIVARK